MAMRDSKSVVLDFFEAANREGLGVLRGLGTDDMQWWVGGLSNFTKEGFLSILEKVENLMKERVKLTVIDIISEGDRVAAEVEGYAPLKNGKVYNNKYHFKIVVRDDKIAQVREYHDSKHAQEVLDLDV
jgi:ketosteroid isomerase-like protein